MAKPVIWTVDDDPDVLRAVERDLRRQYGDRYRVLAADSGAKALEGVKQLKLRNEPIALFLVDQRMPRMSGVEFLEAALEFFPETKRVLLTAYADTDAAIKAINDVQISHYLMKPWDPPEERLYPVIDDILDDWLAAYRPGFEGIRVVGNRWSPASYLIKDFLARNQVPYLWLDVEVDTEAKRLMESALGEEVKLPLVVFPDGTRLNDPNIGEVAKKAGLRTHAEMPFYDLVILGGGPAGLAAAVYGASEGLRTVMIERKAPGGQAGMSSRIENYLGFPSGLSGGDLARRAVAQARRFGVEMLTPQEVHSVKIKDNYRIVTLSDGAEISCHALLIATGVQYRTLEVPGVEKLTGAGVYYGAANTEALSCKSQDVFVVGGANSAGQGAMYLSRFARKVTMLVRGSGLALTMSTYLIEQIAKTPNIDVQTCCRVAEAHGEKNLEAVTIVNDQTGETRKVEAAALFIFIGALPRTECISKLLEVDDHGFILSGEDLTRDGRRPKGWTLDRAPYLLETSVPGIFVAGDVRHGSIKRVASAVGEGSIAIELIHRYLSNVKV
ncbi:MAG: response regulator receiver protein [Pedosphaera sp.]|nr:response regulator receiver protein [Pedosphaera sp.]